ncbi:MAG: FAD-dependent oxidoreductase [Gammaproteobacteria bacterium]|nr:FAD-dependent oxidoreductase [Gammaproteobacteria bacterium]
MKSHAQVVVIGGGVMGTSLIYHLTQLGWQDVVLVEKNELTAGSTWHAAGLCTHYAHNITIMNLRAHSVNLYKSILPEETGQSVSFHACGALRVTRHADRLDEFRQVQGIGKFAGFDFHILTPGELKEMYPLAQVDDLIGAIYEPLDGHVDPSQATQAMAKGARNRGAEIYRQTTVTAIHQKTNGEWLVNTDKGDICAEHIVNAAGTWCREIGDMMGVDLPVVPMLHQYIVSDRIEAFAELDDELPMIRDPDESWYLRMERDGVIIGPYEKHGKPWSIDGVPAEFGMELLEPDIDAIADIAGLAMQRVPAAVEGGIKSIVNGPITFTPDANPLIGPAFNQRNAWLLTGSSMGVMEGGGAGKFLAEWMDAGEPPMDAIAVDARRFGAYADREYRVAKAVECFAAQFGIHYPYEERPAGRNRKLTPAYETLRRRGAVFGSVYGFERPNWYSRNPEIEASSLSFRRANWFETVAAECHNLQHNVGLADLSVFSKFRVSGKNAFHFVDQLGANRAPLRGRIGLTHVLTASAGVASEFSVTRLAEDEFYLVSAAAAGRHDEDLLRIRSQGYDIRIENITDDKGVFGIMGPNAEAMLQGLAGQDLSIESLPWMNARRINIAGIEVEALRVSYVGEAGFELHHEITQQQILLRHLLQAGEKFELGFYGAFAMNAMRLEKGYRAWGSDLTTERSPLEAGLDHLVSTESRNFVGRDALLERAQIDARWSMELLEFDAPEFDPFFMHRLFRGDETVGLVTSGSYGHRLQKAIGLAYFRKPVSMQDELFVEILGRKCGARIIDPL